VLKIHSTSRRESQLGLRQRVAQFIGVWSSSEMMSPSSRAVHRRQSPPAGSQVPGPALDQRGHAGPHGGPPRGAILPSAARQSYPQGFVATHPQIYCTRNPVVVVVPSKKVRLLFVVSKTQTEKPTISLGCGPVPAGKLLPPAVGFVLLPTVRVHESKS
jgi:hypothetical protein